MLADQLGDDLALKLGVKEKRQHRSGTASAQADRAPAGIGGKPAHPPKRGPDQRPKGAAPRRERPAR